MTHKEFNKLLNTPELRPSQKMFDYLLFPFFDEGNFDRQGFVNFYVRYYQSFQEQYDFIERFLP